MKRPKSDFFAARGWLLCACYWIFSMSSQGQPNIRPGMEPDKVLRTITYRSAGVTHMLTLQRVAVQPLGDLEMLRYFKSHPNEYSFPNTAFLLVDSLAGDMSKGRIVWVKYVWHDKAILPQQLWSADVAQPVPINNATETYVVLGKSISMDVDLTVFRVDLNTEVARFPVDLDPAKQAEWPMPSLPLSHFQKDLEDKYVSGIRAINVTIDNGILKIRGEREHDHVPPVTFQFNPGTKEWTQVQTPQSDKSTKKPD